MRSMSEKQTCIKKWKSQQNICCLKYKIQQSYRFNIGFLHISNIIRSKLARLPNYLENIPTKDLSSSINENDKYVYDQKASYQYASFMDQFAMLSFKKPLCIARINLKSFCNNKMFMKLALQVRLELSEWLWVDMKYIILNLSNTKFEFVKSKFPLIC